MGLFNNIKHAKDKTLESDIVSNPEKLKSISDFIDKQADKEEIKNQKEKEYYEKLTPEQKIEYNRIRKRNENIKRMGLYGIAITGSVMGAGVPVLMAAGMKRILSSDDMFFDKEKHDAKVNKIKKGQTSQKTKKSREYIKVILNKDGLPKVKTIVDEDPFNLDYRYEQLQIE